MVIVFEIYGTTKGMICLAHLQIQLKMNLDNFIGIVLKSIGISFLLHVFFHLIVCFSFCISIRFFFYFSTSIPLWPSVFPFHCLHFLFIVLGSLWLPVPTFMRSFLSLHPLLPLMVHISLRSLQSIMWLILHSTTTILDTSRNLKYTKFRTAVADVSFSLASIIFIINLVHFIFYIRRGQTN